MIEEFLDNLYNSGKMDFESIHEIIMKEFDVPPRRAHDIFRKWWDTK